MKKYISLFLTIVLCLSFVLSVNATNGTVYSYNGIEVVFEENSTLSESMKLQVAEMLVNGVSDGEDVAAYNLLCSLFGHKNTLETVETIQHKVDTEAPRCLSQIWELNICTRCENVEETLLYEEYIFCCPEE